MIRFANNKISVSKAGAVQTAEIYVNIKGRRAVRSTSEISLKSLEDMVRKAVETAKAGEPADVYAPLPSGPFKYSKELLKGPAEDLGDEELVGFVEAAVNGGLEGGGKRVAGSLIYTRSKIRLSTTGGVETAAQSGGIEISVRALAGGRRHRPLRQRSCRQQGLQALRGRPQGWRDSEDGPQPRRGRARDI
jgi:predicted Zn-dependent protease